MEFDLLGFLLLPDDSEMRDEQKQKFMIRAQYSSENSKYK